MFMYMLVLLLVTMYAGVESSRGQSIGPMSLEACEARKAEFEKLDYPFLGKNEKLFVTCEPISIGDII